MDVTVKALKHTIILLITNTSFFTLPQKNKVEDWLDRFCPLLNNTDKGGERGEVIAVPNLPEKHPVGTILNNFCPRLWILGTVFITEFTCIL